MNEGSEFENNISERVQKQVEKRIQKKYGVILAEAKEIIRKNNRKKINDSSNKNKNKNKKIKTNIYGYKFQEYQVWGKYVPITSHPIVIPFVSMNREIIRLKNETYLPLKNKNRFHIIYQDKKIKKESEIEPLIIYVN